MQVTSHGHSDCRAGFALCTVMAVLFVLVVHGRIKPSSLGRHLPQYLSSGYRKEKKKNCLYFCNVTYSSGNKITGAHFGFLISFKVNECKRK